MKSQNTSRLGFTLIELLVVVLIIGILSAVALPQYQKAVEKSKVSEALTNISSLKKAIDVWLLANGGIPETRVNFIGCPENEDGKCGILDIDLESVLTCDQEGGKYCRSKNFVYSSSCWTQGGGCVISVSRITNGDMDNENRQYGIGMRINNNGELSKWCDYYPSRFPYTKSLCESMESHGFLAEDVE